MYDQIAALPLALFYAHYSLGYKEKMVISNKISPFFQETQTGL